MPGRAGLAARRASTAFDDGVGIVQGKGLPVPSAPTTSSIGPCASRRRASCTETANIFYRRDAFEQAGGFPASELSPNALFPSGVRTWPWPGVKRTRMANPFLGGSAGAPRGIPDHAVAVAGGQAYITSARASCGTSPETRRFFYRGYFFDRVQAALVLGLVSAAAAVLSSGWAGVGILPYLWVRGSEPTVALRGPLHASCASASTFRATWFRWPCWRWAARGSAPSSSERPSDIAAVDPAGAFVLDHRFDPSPGLPPGRRR